MQVTGGDTSEIIIGYLPYAKKNVVSPAVQATLPL